MLIAWVLKFSVCTTQKATLPTEHCCHVCLQSESWGRALQWQVVSCVLLPLRVSILKDRKISAGDQTLIRHHLVPIRQQLIIFPSWKKQQSSLPTASFPSGRSWWLVMLQWNCLAVFRDGKMGLFKCCATGVMGHDDMQLRPEAPALLGSVIMFLVLKNLQSHKSKWTWH